MVKKTPTLSAGHSYLFLERGGSRGYETFVRHLTDGIRGLWISSSKPREAGRAHPVRSAVVWLSAGGGGNGAQTISPRKPHKLLITVREFLKSKGGKVVLMDGMESVLAYNPFEVVMQVLQRINDEVATRGGILIFSMGCDRLKRRERSLLEREFETLDEELVVLSLFEDA